MAQQVNPILVDDTLRGGLVVTDISPSGMHVEVSVPSGYRLVGTEVVALRAAPGADDSWAGTQTGILSMAQAEALFVEHAP